MPKETKNPQNENARAGALPNPALDLGALPFSRRAMLGGIGMVAASPLFISGDAYGMGSDEEELIQQTASEHARPTSHPDEVFDLPRWIPEKTGNFDLTNPVDNLYAFGKAQANLAGEFSWFAQYGWIMIAPPGRPVYPFLGRMKLAKIFVTPTDPDWVEVHSEHHYTVWLTATETFYDPRDFTPVSRIRNPYTDRMIDVPVLHYADRIVFQQGEPYEVPGFDPDFYTQQWDRDSDFSQHYIDVGDEITYTFLGASQFDGPHQPRCDIGFWTVKKDELMNPNLRMIDTRRDYSIIQKMTEFSWYGAPEGDRAQIFSHTTGIKTENVDHVPGIVKRGIIDRFPERFSVA